MAHLIDKDALVAEIEKLKCKISDDSSYCNGWQHALRMLELSLNPFEVKEMDLEKELIEWHKEHFQKDGTFIGMSGFYLTNNSQMDIAKHFFELGLNASNPITAADRGTANEIIINLKRVEKDYRINLAKEIEWVRNKAQKGE